MDPNRNKINQRDPRTSIRIKRFGVVFVLLLCIINVAFSTIMIIFSNPCLVNQVANSVAYYVQFVTLALSVASFVFSVYILTNEMWAWYMATTPSPTYETYIPFERDVEDNHAGVLQRQGHQLKEDFIRVHDAQLDAFQAL